jgi:hypothetical protein
MSMLRITPDGQWHYRATDVDTHFACGLAVPRSRQGDVRTSHRACSVCQRAAAVHRRTLSPASTSSRSSKPATLGYVPPPPPNGPTSATSKPALRELAPQEPAHSDSGVTYLDLYWDDIISLREAVRKRIDGKPYIIPKGTRVWFQAAPAPDGRKPKGAKKKIWVRVSHASEVTATTLLGGETVTFDVSVKNLLYRRGSSPRPSRDGRSEGVFIVRNYRMGLGGL